MFLIINDGRVLRATGSRASIGSAASAEIRLADPQVDALHATLFRDKDDRWWLARVGIRPVFVNDSEIASDTPVVIHPPATLRIGPFLIQCRLSGIPRPILDRLRGLLFELELTIHKSILDELKSRHAGLGADDRQLVEAQLTRVLGGLKLEAELESFLASEGLRTMLIDRIHGYGGKDKKRMRVVAELGKRFGGLLTALESRMHLSLEKSPARQIERVETLLSWAIQADPSAIKPGDRHEIALTLIRQDLLDLIFGLGPLEDLLLAPDINDIMVLPTGQIFVEQAGKIQDSGRRMLSPAVSLRIVERIVSREGRRIDQTSPMVDSRMEDGSRLNAIIPPLSVEGPALTIRRFADRPFDIRALVENETMTSAASEFLRAAVRARKNIIILGGTGSGKTTLLGALASYIDVNERIVTVEDTAEIKMTQPHVVCLQAKPPNMEGHSAVGIRDLVRNALRMRPDRIIVGECRSGEALDMLQAMNTGHDGSLTTIHANSPWDGIRRLEVMSMEAEGIELPSVAIREQIVSAVDVLVQINRLSGENGRRRIVSICEVVGLDEETNSVIVEEVYRHRRLPGVFGRSVLTFTGYVPSFINDLLRVGMSVDSLD